MAGVVSLLPGPGVDGAGKILAAVFRKAEFCKRHAAAPLNERQRDMLNRLLDGFEGKLTSSKYAIIEKTSPDTALRDITDLVDRPGTGRKQHGRESDAFTRLEQERDFERQERMERAASKTASAETARRG